MNVNEKRRLFIEVSRVKWTEERRRTRKVDQVDNYRHNKREEASEVVWQYFVVHEKKFVSRPFHLQDERMQVRDAATSRSHWRWYPCTFSSRTDWLPCIILRARNANTNISLKRTAEESEWVYLTMHVSREGNNKKVGSHLFLFFTVQTNCNLFSYFLFFSLTRSHRWQFAQCTDHSSRQWDVWHKKKKKKRKKKVTSARTSVHTCVQVSLTRKFFHR